MGIISLLKSLLKVFWEDEWDYEISFQGIQYFIRTK
jgi:hypothetical protein